MKHLSAEDIIILNTQIQLRFGTVPSIRDAAALDYIVKSASQEVFGRLLYGSLEELAAFYLLKVTEKHVFNDANKRTAFQSCALFLNNNGYQLKEDRQIDVAKQIVLIAQVDGEDDALWQSTFEMVKGAIVQLKK